MTQGYSLSFSSMLIDKLYIHFLLHSPSHNTSDFSYMHTKLCIGTDDK